MASEQNSSEPAITGVLKTNDLFKTQNQKDKIGSNDRVHNVSYNDLFDVVYDESFDLPRSNTSNVSCTETGVVTESEISGRRSSD